MRTLLAASAAALLLTGCPPTAGGGGGDAGSVAQPMCAPCVSDGDCGPQGSGFCVDETTGAKSGFCAPLCEKTADCAAGATCFPAQAGADVCYPSSKTCVGYHPTGATASAGSTAATTAAATGTGTGAGAGTSGGAAGSVGTTGAATTATAASSTGAATTASSSGTTHGTTSSSSSSSTSGATGTPITCANPGTYSMNGGSCGVERWAVKTGTDADVSMVNMSPIPATIAALAALPAPAGISSGTYDNSRISPTETQVVILTNIEVTEIKSESDSDYHLVLNDGSGNTMIGEVPYPGCVGSTSPFACFITHARGAVDMIGTTSTTQYATIIGVPFFDYAHGQTGVAPNAIEIHPILSICFGQDCTAPTSYLQLRDHEPGDYQWLLPPPFGTIPPNWLTGQVDEEDEENDDEIGHPDERREAQERDREALERAHEESR